MGSNSWPGFYHGHGSGSPSLQDLISQYWQQHKYWLTGLKWLLDAWHCLTALNAQGAPRMTRRDRTHMFNELSPLEWCFNRDIPDPNSFYKRYSHMAIVRKFGKPNPCPTVQISFDKSFGSRKNHWWISSPEFWIVAPADSGVASGREILPTVTPCTVGVHPGGPWDGQVPTASLKVWKSHWVNMELY